MQNILSRIKSGEILLSDGAMGTMLMSKGLKSGECPEVFNLVRLDILKEIAQAYLDAGADLIQTNTFGASPIKLAFYGLEGKTEEINRNAVLAVKEIVAGKAYVNASVGPSGKMIYPLGELTQDLLFDNYFRQIKALISAGADVISIETMTDILEAVLAVKAAKQINKDIPVIASMTFEKTKRGYYTIMGVTIAKATEELKNAGADIIGSNCGYGILNMIEIAEEFRKCSDLPVIIQSNAGVPGIQNGNLIFPESNEFMSSRIKGLVDSGVSIIGGCCGTTPEYISAFRKELNLVSPAKSL
jgi:5-methyltetrahydrofolate--homocysteine methyltransferase